MEQLEKIEPGTPNMYAPMMAVQPETKEYLKGWRRPTYAYILFEKREWHLLAGGALKQGTGLFTLNVENRPEQSYKLIEYVNKKRFRVIDYGNFPKLNDKNARRAAKALMHSGKDRVNPWDVLEQDVKSFMSMNPSWREERASLIAERDALEAKYRTALAKQGADNGNTNREAAAYREDAGLQADSSSDGESGPAKSRKAKA